MSDELRECPNPACRSTDLVVVMNQYAGTFFPRCNVCLMTGPAMPTKAEARAAWNALPREVVWSSEKPKVAGWCWSRHVNRGGLAICEFDDYDLARQCGCESCSGFRVAGPIPTPLEAK